MSACCYHRCGRAATQAFDVWSWWKEIRSQTPVHYEVCDRHAHLFDGYTGAAQDRKTFMVEERCEPTPLSAAEVHALRERALLRGL